MRGVYLRNAGPGRRRPVIRGPRWLRVLCTAATVAGALVVVSASPAWADPLRALAQQAEEADLKWQPDLDYDQDSCYSSPAISPDGEPNPGLRLTSAQGSITEGCREPAQLFNTNAYVRVWCSGEWCAHKYALYFMKDQMTTGGGRTGKPDGHTHDFEHIVVWVKNDVVRFVAASAHGGYEVKAAADVRFDGTHPKIVYHKDGGFTHAFRFATAADEPPENAEGNWRRPTLVSWNRFPRDVRQILATHDYGSASLALTDGRYASDLRKAKPDASDFDFDFDAALPDPDPPADPPTGPADPGPKPSADHLVIEPLGDSITAGVGSSTSSSYRAVLYNSLASNKPNFVGSHVGGALPDQDHEGNSGFTIGDIAGIAETTLRGYEPNVVLLHIGTNDMDKPVSPDTAPDRLRALLDTITRTRPGAVVLVAKIVPSTHAATQARIETYNSRIPGVVKPFADAGHRVAVVDMASVVTTADLADYLHPSDIGYRKMAGVWLKGLLAAQAAGWIDGEIHATPDRPVGCQALDIAGIDANKTMKLYSNNGDGTLLDGGPMGPQNGAWAGFTAIAAADFISDGVTDIAGIDANHDMKLYTGDGNGNLSGGTAMFPTGGRWAGFSAITAGDFNGDRNADIAGIDANHNLKLYAGDGRGHLTDAGPMFPTGGRWAGFTSIAAADFDLDGDIDIAGIDANDDLKLYAGDGAGHVTEAGPMFRLGLHLWAGFTAIVGGDFNCDGAPDIAGIDANHDLKLYPGLPGVGPGVLEGGPMWPQGGRWTGFAAIASGNFDNNP